MINSILKSLLLSIRKNVKIKIYRHLKKNCHIEIDNKSMLICDKGLYLEDNSWLIAHDGGKIIIGNNVSLNRNTICCSRQKIEIKNNVSIGPNVCIYDHDHDFDGKGKKEGFKKSEITIGNNVWIGAGSIILRGTVIGDNTIVGAGSIVKGIVPANSIIINKRDTIIKPL